MGRFYLRAEAVNLDNFIFDTSDLSTIRGGGLLLLEAPGRISSIFLPAIHGVSNINVISEGASIGIFSFEYSGDHPGVVRDELLKMIQDDRQLGHATFVADIVPDNGNFERSLEELTAMNRWRQMQSPRLILPNSPSPENFCEIDLVRPAESTETKGPRQLDVSRSVKVRRECGREKKQSFYHKVLSDVTTSDARFTDFEYDSMSTSDFRELAEFADAGNSNRKMAVCHFDGNGFGALRDQYSHSESVFTSFSQTLRNRQNEFLADLLRQMTTEIEPNGKDGGTFWFSHRGRARIEILLWGGDEMTIVVPAWKGIELLEVFYRNARLWKVDSSSGKIANSGSGIPLFHAAGIVFCHDTAPIQRMTKLADNLASIAKEFDRTRNMIAYQVLESFDIVASDLKQFRDNCTPAGCRETGGEILLDGDKVGIIANLAKLWSKLTAEIPRGKLHAFIEALSRNDEKRCVDLEGELQEAIQRAGAHLDLPIAFGNGRERWLHLQDLWDYIPQPRKGY